VSLAYRPAEVDDLVCIVGNWIDSFRSAHAAGMIAMADWKAVMTPQIRRVLARQNVEAFVAHHPGETDHVADIYGWIAVERGHAQPLVHYCYVKSAYRKQGIARGLFRAAAIDPAKPFFYTCKTYVIHELRSKSLILSARWQPLIARRAEDQHQARGDHGQTTSSTRH
jgi:GNAT superfamily N-acetyltransferase